MISLRTCKLSDLKEILCLEAESFKQPYDRATFKYFLDIASEGFIVAEEEGRISGYIIFIVIRGYGIIISLAVLPDIRRRGFGTYMLQYALNQLKQKTHEVKLQVRVSNHKAIDFYSKNGFISDSTIKEYYLDNEDALVMKKTV
jgi:ribosomal-protein-alanine N-acetyltransferase